MGRDIVIGVISDTHGLLRDAAIAALQGVDRIVHAGDVGGEQVLAALERLAPVTAVAGNTDRMPLVARLPTTAVLETAHGALYVLHDIGQLDLDPATSGFAVVVSGHTHRPSIERRDGVLYLNPGSAGPRRNHLPASLALLRVARDGTSAAESLALTASD